MISLFCTYQLQVGLQLNFFENVFWYPQVSTYLQVNFFFRIRLDVLLVSGG